MDTLRQVGELLLGAVPTVVLLLMLYWCTTYWCTGHWSGYWRNAGQDQGADRAGARRHCCRGAKTAEYENRLREAKIAIFNTGYPPSKKHKQARTSAVAKAKPSRAQVKEARRAICERDSGR